jgi:hypothetical protein
VPVKSILYDADGTETADEVGDSPATRAARPRPRSDDD